MAMSSGRLAEISAIERQLAVLGVPTRTLNEISGVDEIAAELLWRLGIKRIEDGPGIGAQQPKRLLLEPGGLKFEVPTAKQDSPGAESVTINPVVVGSDREQTTAIVVAQKRDGTVRACEVLDEVEHIGETRPNPFRKGDPVPTRVCQALKVQIGCVAMVVGRKLAIDAITRNLLLHFIQKR